MQLMGIAKNKYLLLVLLLIGYFFCPNKLQAQTKVVSNAITNKKQVADSIAGIKRLKWIAKRDSIAAAKIKTVIKKTDTIAKQVIKKTEKIIFTKPNADSVKKAKRKLWIAKRDSIAAAKNKTVVKKTDTVAKQIIKKVEKIVVAKPNADSVKEAKRKLWIAKRDSVAAAKNKTVVKKTDTVAKQVIKKVEKIVVAKPNADSVKEAKRKLWIAKRDSVVAAKNKTVVKKTDTIAKQIIKKTEKIIVAKPNADSVKEAKRKLWIAKRDSVAAAKNKTVVKKTDTVAKQIIKKTEKIVVAKPNADSVKEAKRKLWIAKRDSVAAAKNKTVVKKIDTVVKSGVKKIEKSTKKALSKVVEVEAAKSNINTTDAQQSLQNENVVTNEILINNYGADDIVTEFSTEEFGAVIKKSKEYLQKFPTDTNIIIKTGLSYLFTKKFKQGFSLIDDAFVDKDSLLKFYSILPFINQNAKLPGVYESIVNHCRQLSATSIWTYFNASTMFNARGQMDSALHYGYLSYSNISNPVEANSLGYFYPTLLFQQQLADSALQIMEQLSNTYPASISLDVNMYAMLLKQKQYEKAYFYINKMIAKDKTNEDYFNEKLDLCILLKKYDEACELLTEVKDVYDYDVKIFKAHCSKEFFTIPFQHQIKYVWKVNQNGESFQVAGTVDASSSAVIKWNFENTGKAANKGYYTIGASQFDTARVIDASYLNSTKNTDSSSKIVTWISKQCYNEIEKNQQTMLDFGNGLGMFTVVQIDETEADNFDANTFTDRIVTPNGDKKLVETYHLLNAETNEQIWVLKNITNPLIVKMTGNYTIELSEVSKQ